MGRKAAVVEEETTNKKIDFSKLAKTLQKSFPDDNVNTLEASDSAAGVTVPWYISTGAPSLDWIMGRGVPGGRLIEIFSNQPSEGKSSTLSSIIASAQRDGAPVLLLDSENGTLSDRMVQLGVNPADLLFSSPTCMEKGFSICQEFIKNVRSMDKECPVLIAWDSIGVTPTSSELETDYDARTIGLTARVLSSSLRKFTPVLRENNVAMVCTNQVREKIGAMAFAETKETVGGMGLKFYAHIRIGLSRIKNLKQDNDKDEKETYGIEVAATCKKNKVARPFRKTTLQILASTGLDGMNSEFTLALASGLLEKHAAGYYSIMGSEDKFRYDDYKDKRTPELLEKIAGVLG